LVYIIPTVTCRDFHFILSLESCALSLLFLIFNLHQFNPLIKFSTTILQFKEQGEKTGWSYIEVSAELAQKLKPGNKKSFRVKGKIDAHPIRGIALLPMGEGRFIMALNVEMRKEIGKGKGAKVTIQLDADDEFSFTLPPDLQECLNDEPKAMNFFQSLAKGHQGYFVKWVLSAKTDETKAKRMAQMITALMKKQDFGTMLRSLKQNRSDLSR
jgi:hypothetical protein